jgi:hypothetical protein
MERTSDRRSSAASMAKPGSLAARKRLSGLGSAAAPPPATEKPYLAGELSQERFCTHVAFVVVVRNPLHVPAHTASPRRTAPACRSCLLCAEHKVAAAVSSRVSQKAGLMQYLAGHASTVGRMLHSIPEANAAAGGAAAAPTDAAFSATAPAAAAVFNTPPFPTATATTTAAAAAGARKSSVSAYLAGQQDLLTTITDGVPYASGLPGMLGAGSSSSTANSTATASIRCSTASYCSGGSSSILSAGQSTGAASSCPSAANSRHSAVKEALSARISGAGEDGC